MEKIIIGKKDNSKKYNFRETCFGIVVKNDKLYCTEKENELSLIGGGIEKGENHIECLKREFLEEAGLMIKSAELLCTIDCFWLTKDKNDMESLTHIYIVEVFDKALEPTEEGCKLTSINLKEAIDLLSLPYHKKALEEYYKKMNFGDVP